MKPTRRRNENGASPIGETAGRLALHPRTLMAWERLGLVRPARVAGRRVYSDSELRWLECLQEFNRKGGVSLQGVATLLRFVPCWAIRAQLGESETGCAPAQWPADRCLSRVKEAFEGTAPAECRKCGVYRERQAGASLAWSRRHAKGVAALAAPAVKENA